MRYLYMLLTAVPIFYSIIAIYSYYYAVMTFGQVPSSQDFTWDLIKDKGGEFNIFPIDYGKILIYVSFLGFVYGIPTVTIVNGFLILINRSFTFYKWHLLTAVLVYVGVGLLLRVDAIGWYLGYALD